MKIYYTGIGSRETPANALAAMKNAAAHLASEGLVLRSGAADGADMAFEEGCDANNGGKEIYIPWNGFNGRTAGPSVHAGVTDIALGVASQFHPNWDACTKGAKQLHGRNVYQVLGLGLNAPSTMVLCWTPGAKGGGGTGQAIRIARHHNVPVFDFAHPDILTQLSEFMKTFPE